MSKETSPKIDSIKIDPDGRYTLLASGIDKETALEIASRLSAWWESDERFVVLYSTPDIEFRVERVDDNRAGVA